MVLCAAGGKIPKVSHLCNFASAAISDIELFLGSHQVCSQICYLSLHHHPQDLSWNAGKKFMGNVDTFLKSLISFDKDNVCVACVDKVRSDEKFMSDTDVSSQLTLAGMSAALGALLHAMMSLHDPPG